MRSCSLAPIRNNGELLSLYSEIGSRWVNVLVGTMWMKASAIDFLQMFESQVLPGIE